MRSRRLPTSFFWMFTCGAFRLHSAGVSLCIPPVAPADVPAIPAQDLGHLPAVLQTITCGAETRLPSGGCIPAVLLICITQYFFVPLRHIL